MKSNSESSSGIEHDPLWYKKAIIYELHVRAFRDSNGDGIGDFKGLAEKLDYLQDLGITAVWLLPFYPSPLRDDGYDIADYRQVHPDYGSLTDFKRVVREAHKRGLRIITELVINHTSDQHPWFQKARRAAAGTNARDYYVWSDDPSRYADARIIFKDFEHSNWAWDPVAEAYYWHRFYSNQPDLNFENPSVKKAIFRVVDFWLRMGVDGMRLDAVPYLFEEEGTNCENLPATHDFLRELRSYIESRYSDRMLLAEANQWPEDAVAYFGKGDESHMNFHFPLMPRLFMSIRLEDRFPILDILEQTPPIPESCQWALFLRNHDELTLEMVTEEERDYMYRVYAADPRARINLGIRRRLAPLLGNNRRKIELMNGLLFSLPGTPVLYYGDEIGMGDNIHLGDRHGVRTPMQWSADRNAGFSEANPQSLYLPIIIDPEYHAESVNVETQQRNPNSLLWWMKRLIALRKRFKSFGQGSLDLLQPDNRKVLAFIRSFEDENILVVANLSRFTQYVELDLARFRGAHPLELFGRAKFPDIGDLPYFITLGPHSFYWFLLQEKVEVSSRATSRLERKGKLTLSILLAQANRDRVSEELDRHLSGSTWFGGGSRRIRALKLKEMILQPKTDGKKGIFLLEVEYHEGDGQSYVIPMCIVSDPRTEEIQRAFPNSIICGVEDSDAIVHDAIVDSDFCKGLFNHISSQTRWSGKEGHLEASARSSRHSRPEDDLEPQGTDREQRNSSIVFGHQYVLKLYRRLEPSPHPEVEIGKYLTKRKSTLIAPLIGITEYETDEAVYPVAVLHKYIPNEGDVLQLTLDALGRYFERALSEEGDPPGQLRETILPLEEESSALSELDSLIGSFPESTHLLGRRLADLHLALSKAEEDPAFKPEPFNTFSRRSLYQSFRNLVGRVFPILRRSLKGFDAIEALAREVLGQRTEILDRFRRIMQNPIESVRIRCHGDMNLTEVLFTGKDFVFLDFEGDPHRPSGERRLKRSPAVDLAAILISLEEATLSALTQSVQAGLLREEQIENFQPWVEAWLDYTTDRFLNGYLGQAANAPFLPPERDHLEMLLRCYLLQRSILIVGRRLEGQEVGPIRPSLKRILALLS